MKKLFIWMLVLCLTPVCMAQRTNKPLTDVRVIDGDVLHTIQSGWVIAESENSADTQTDALGVTERTKNRLDIVIAANAAQEEYISYFLLPPEWNNLQFRGCGITDDGTMVHQIYFGTLGDELDCEFVYAAQFSWIVGQQSSIYDQITFTDGGVSVPRIGDKVTGNTSGETAFIVAISALSSGAWADGDAAGTITYKSASGTFTNSETVTISRGGGNVTLNGFAHAASDLVDFEMAQSVTVTAKSWSAAFAATSNIDSDWVGEVEVDKKGADIMVVVTTATTADSKLLVTGY